MKCFLEAMFRAPSALKLAGLGNAEDYAELLAGIEGVGFMRPNLSGGRQDREVVRGCDDVISGVSGRGARRSGTQVPDPDCESFRRPCLISTSIRPTTQIAAPDPTRSAIAPTSACDRPQTVF